MLGDLEPIARDYLLAGLSRRRRELRSCRIGARRGRAGRSLSIETRWLQETTNGEAAFPTPLSAASSLHKPDAEKLHGRASAAIRNVRGIRQIVNWHRNPRFSFTDHDFLDRPRLARRLQPAPQIRAFLRPSALSRADGRGGRSCRRNPETLIVVNHTGMPLERDEAGPRALARRHEAPCRRAKRRRQGLRSRHGRLALERGEHPALRAGRHRLRSASTGPCSAAIFRSTSSIARSIRSTALSRASSRPSPRARRTSSSATTRSAITGSEPEA